MYGPLKAVFTDEGTFHFEYYQSFNENEDRSLFTETGTYTVSGNKLKYNSEYGYSGEVLIEAFTGHTAIFNIPNEDIGFSVKASKSSLMYRESNSLPMFLFETFIYILLMVDKIIESL